MKTKIIANINQKGGSGKTTTAHNLAICLALKGHNVGFIDLDPQKNSTVMFGARNWGDPLLGETLSNDVMNGKIKSTCKPFWHETCKTLAILPSNIDLARIALNISTNTYKEKILSNFLMTSPIFKKMDYILIDCAPSLDVLTINATYAATNFLIPVDCEGFALEGMAALLQTISEVKETDIFEDFWILLTKVDPREKIVNQQVNVYLETNGLLSKVLNTKIKKLSSFVKSTINHVPVSLTKDPAGEYYQLLADEIIMRCKND
jgi:chromosome partitioning protein